MSSARDRLKHAVGPAARRQRSQQAVRAVTGRLGIEVRRAGRGRRHEMGEVLAHLTELGHAPRTIVDVGVGHGTPQLYAAFPDAHLVLVEPLEPEFGGAIERILAERPGHWARGAAGAAPGRTTIEVHPAAVLSSTRSVGGVPREVDVVTVDDAVAASGAPAGPLLLKVDVEGGELDVLDGAEQTLARAEVVLLEVALFRFADGVPLLHEVLSAMAARGWVTHDVYDGGLRPLDGQLGRIDVAFVREDGPFRRDHRYATERQLAELQRAWGY